MGGGRRMLSRLASVPARVLIFLIELYRTYVSPLRLPTCRFTPSCSEYAVTALREHGALRGSVLTAVRLAKCAPWHPGGWDPVPERRAGPRGSGGSVDRTGAPVAANEQRST
ncbi:MAG TPA: membrane protein insertion efficiency factor YidD [Aldersonia sp.]